MSVPVELFDPAELEQPTDPAAFLPGIAKRVDGALSANTRRTYASALRQLDAFAARHGWDLPGDRHDQGRSGPEPEHNGVHFFDYEERIH
jgi:hypothetical protein